MRPRRRQKGKLYSATPHANAKAAGSAYSYALGWRASDLLLPGNPEPIHCGVQFYYQDGLWLPLREKAASIARAMNSQIQAGYQAAFVGLWGNTSNSVPQVLPPSPPEAATKLWDNPETVTEEILAYRAWGYRTRLLPDASTEITLLSLNQTEWPGPTLKADEAPGKDNTNGLHAIGLQPHHHGNWESYLTDHRIWGQVALSGLVIEGRNGFRAEQQTIRELWVGDPACDCEDDPDCYQCSGHQDDAEALCKLLGDRYQCDCSVKIPDWEEMVNAQDQKAV